MLRFSANTSLLFQELPFLDRFAAARDAGFEAVECWFPYGRSIAELHSVLDAEGLSLVGVNTAAGDRRRGEWGLGALPGRNRPGRCPGCYLLPQRPMPTIRASLAGDGTRGTSTQRGKRSAPGRYGRVLAVRAPGGPENPLTGKRQQWRGTVGRPTAAWPAVKLRQRSEAAGRRVDRDRNRRRRGRRKGGPFAEGDEPSIGRGVGVRAPVAPSPAFAGGAGGAGGSGENGPTSDEPVNSHGLERALNWWLLPIAARTRTGSAAPAALGLQSRASSPVRGAPISSSPCGRITKVRPSGVRIAAG
jgi:hypothetical protein